jgi:superfamily II DNA or RNA helicase
MITNGSSHTPTDTMNPYPYQLEAVSWMEQRERCKTCRGGFLCHEMGLGKTVMTTTLLKRRLVNRTLILTPKSTLLGWLDTLRTVGNFAFNVYEFRKGLVLPEDRPLVLVATHQSILRHRAWFATAGFQRILVDEAHVLRNLGGKVSQTILALARSIPIRWGVTATPYNNKDSDINAYMAFLFPHLAPDARPPTVVFKHVMLRKLRAEVFPTGPKLVIRKHVYEFEHPEEQEMYDFVSQRIDQQAQWLAANRGHLPHHVVGAMIILQMLRERQATIHPQIVLNAERVWRNAWGVTHDVPEWDKTRVTKINHVLEMVRADQADYRSTLVITHFKDEITLIAERLGNAGVAYKILNGKTGKVERRRIETHGSGMSRGYTGAFVDAWAEQKTGRNLPEDVVRNLLTFTHRPTVVLMQIQAGGVGISLPWIHHVINMSPDWNPFLERQAIFRAYRLTTPHDVHVTQLFLRDTIDRTIHTKQMQKLARSLFWTGDAEHTIHDFAEPEMIDAEDDD